MASVATYRIEDEPRPGALAQLAVSPMWPLLSVMLGGFLVGMAWFTLNSWVVGSPTKVRETVTAALGLVGALAIALAIALGEQMGYLGDVSVQFAVLPLLIFKLGIGYLLYEWQSRTVQIYEYFGGTLRNGVFVLVAAALTRKQVLLLVPIELWQLVVS